MTTQTVTSETKSAEGRRNEPPEKIAVSLYPLGAKRAIGNQALLRMYARQPPALQAKLRVNPPGDVFEQEADRVADHVMRMPAAGVVSRSSLSDATDGVQRKCSCGGEGGECAACKEKKESALHRFPAGLAPPASVPPAVHQVLRSSGQPLDATSLDFMETRFGWDFGHVRVHADSRAAESARSVSALAYTVGRNIVFDAGRYSPGTPSGQRLLAHELTHVLQQESRLPIIQREPAKPADAEQRAIEVEARACVSNDEQGALETLDNLDMRDLLNVTAKLFDNYQAGGACGFGTLNADLFLTPPTPETKEATKNVNVPRLRAAFDAARVHKQINPKPGVTATTPTLSGARERSKPTGPARPGDWGKDPEGNVWVAHTDGIHTYWTTKVRHDDLSSAWLGNNPGNYGYNKPLTPRAIGSFKWWKYDQAIYLTLEDAYTDLFDNVKKYATIRKYAEEQHLDLKVDSPSIYYNNIATSIAANPKVPGVKFSPDDSTATWVNDATKWEALREAIRFAEGWPQRKDQQGVTLDRKKFDEISSKPEAAALRDYYRTLLGVPATTPPAEKSGSAVPAGG